MPVYKTSILNKEINVNYEDNEKDKLEEAIKQIKLKLDSFQNPTGKISDTKILSFLAIKLQAEILELNENKKTDLTFQKKINESNNKNINLNDKLYKLSEKNKLLENEKELINSDLKKIQSQIELIINLIKSTYEE